MNRATKIAVGGLVLFIAILIYAKPGLQPRGPRPSGGAPQDPSPVQPVGPDRLDPPAAAMPVDTPPSVVRTLDLLGKEVDAGATALNALKDLLTALEKNAAPAEAESSISSLGGRLATLKLRDEVPLLARSVDEVIATQGLPAATSRGVARVIADIGRRIRHLAGEAASHLARIKALRSSSTAAWAGALVGLEAEVMRYEMTLKIAQGTAEAESNRLEHVPTGN